MTCDSTNATEQRLYATVVKSPPVDVCCHSNAQTQLVYNDSKRKFERVTKQTNPTTTIKTENVGLKNDKPHVTSTKTPSSLFGISGRNNSNDSTKARTPENVAITKHDPKPNKIEVVVTNNRNQYQTKEQWQHHDDNRQSQDECITYSDEPVFESVGSKSTQRYYVGGIASYSNRAGLYQFLRQKGIKPVGIRMMKTFNGNLAAKITIESHQCHIVENKRFWPRKTYCRRWYGENQWNSLFSENYDNSSYNY